MFVEWWQFILAAWVLYFYHAWSMNNLRETKKKAFFSGQNDGNLIQRGKNVGVYEVLCYAKDTLSEPKFKEFSDEFGYETLQSMYGGYQCLRKK